MWFPVLCIFAKLFWRARETLVKQSPDPDHDLEPDPDRKSEREWQRGDYDSTILRIYEKSIQGTINGSTLKSFNR